MGRHGEPNSPADHLAELRAAHEREVLGVMEIGRRANLDLDAEGLTFREASALGEQEIQRQINEET
jgi:hypothetical protein